MNKCTMTNADRANVFLRLAEDYCKKTDGEKTISPTHQKYQAPSTKFLCGVSTLRWSSPRKLHNSLRIVYLVKARP